MHQATSLRQHIQHTPIHIPFAHFVFFPVVVFCTKLVSGNGDRVMRNFASKTTKWFLKNSFRTDHVAIGYEFEATCQFLSSAFCNDRKCENYLK